MFLLKVLLTYQGLGKKLKEMFRDWKKVKLRERERGGREMYELC
jgi:hypothetical protein